LQVGRGSKKRRILLRNFREIFALAMIPVVLIGIAAGAFLAFRSLRPIRDLINTVSDIEAGKMDARVPYRGTGDELDELARLFNKMLERIKSLIDRMQDTLDDVAHDLKTPVTRLRNVIETTLQSRCDRETLREALMDCAEESERIVAMLETLMDISEAEAGTIALNIEEVQIESLIRDVVELYEYVAEEKGVEIMFQACASLVARVDPNRIRQVISNLLDNAVKYTSKGGMIEIRSDKKDDGIMISIKDTGTGIPRKELPRIFDRLYRGDKSRSSRGIGLGLSLVKAVIHAHKGRIEVESYPGMGSCFTIYLPRNQNSV
jgi:heavy metal sensor kinase